MGSGVNSLVVKISDNSDSYLSEKTIKAPVTMPEKQLELSKRNAFFKDPFFQDMVGGMGDGLEKRLAEFSARSMGVAGAGLNEAAHNIQVSASKDDIIIVEAVHEAQTEDGSTDSRKFTKEFKMPA